jgi:peptidoglycan/xylan/chitin deacetylase (PgdA/CDA1 family)
MKAIISHDIDHITVWEHLFKDTIIPKYLTRMHIELLTNKISLREYTLRWSDFFKNKWQNVDELITFNNISGVPSSFFVAVNKGLGLNYSNTAAMLWIEQMQSRRCEIGLHGIEFEHEEKIGAERDLFRELTGAQKFGIRMHYVRNNENTYRLLAQAGYRYDSTVHAYKNPYKIGEMWEFPFQIMDGWIIENYKSWQSLNLEQAKTNTIRLIEKAREENLQYLGIDFHDRYFSHSFKTWLDWYMWLVEYLRNSKIEFVNFEMAIKELEESRI